jgi:hypothetical protein
MDKYVCDANTPYSRTYIRYVPYGGCPTDFLRLIQEESESFICEDFWGSVAYEWNKRFSKGMKLSRIQAGEIGIRNEDDSLRVVLVSNRKLALDRGKTTMLTLRKLAKCIRIALRKKSRLSEWDVVVKVSFEP